VPVPVISLEYIIVVVYKSSFGFFLVTKIFALIFSDGDDWWKLHENPLILSSFVFSFSKHKKSEEHFPSIQTNPFRLGRTSRFQAHVTDL
jgi:hypothetical protein